jgi:hypothetical protein
MTTLSLLNLMELNLPRRLLMFAAYRRSQARLSYISIVGLSNDTVGISINDSLIPGTYQITGTFNDDVVVVVVFLGDVLFSRNWGL